MEILKNPWKKKFLRLVSESKESIKMTSPFVKGNICNELISVKNKKSKIELYTSFKLMNIYSGSLDLNGLESIINEKGIIRNKSRLHSKIYLFDYKRVIITSANLTNGGLLYNYEYGVYTEEKGVIERVVEDFDSLSKDLDIGTVKLQDIEEVRKILSNIEKKESVKIPQYDLESPESNNDVIELPVGIIDTSLKGWTLDVFKCLELISKQEFSLQDTHKFIPLLEKKYPNNSHIQAKIRQQLQFLRDYGLIEFKGNGNYRKLWK